MPTPPQKGETKKEFIARCIEQYIEEDYDQKQAAAICYDTWRKAKEDSAKSKAEKRNK